MEFRGRIYKILDTKSGTSASGNNWSRQDFIFEYFEHPSQRYSDRVVLSLMNDQIRENNLKEGDEVVIGFGMSVREYNGKYYNEPRMYKIEKAGDAGTVKQPEQVQQQQQMIFEENKKEGEKDDDMPF